MFKKRGQNLLEYGFLLLLLVAILVGSLGLFGQTAVWLYSSLNQGVGGAAQASAPVGGQPTAWPTVSLAPSPTPPSTSAPLPSGLVACQIAETFDRTVTTGWGNLSPGLTWVSSNPNNTSVTPGQAILRPAAGGTVGVTLTFSPMYAPVDILISGYEQDLPAGSADVPGIDWWVTGASASGLAYSVNPGFGQQGPAPTQPWVLRLHLEDGQLGVKLWSAAEPEPGNWQTQNLTAPTNTTSLGFQLTDPSSLIQSDSGLFITQITITGAGQC
jgi:hypothetical protein